MTSLSDKNYEYGREGVNFVFLLDENRMYMPRPKHEIESNDT